jgi:hypothetical protein
MGVRVAGVGSGARAWSTGCVAAGAAGGAGFTAGSTTGDGSVAAAADGPVPSVDRVVDAAGSEDPAPAADEPDAGTARDADSPATPAAGVLPAAALGDVADRGGGVRAGIVPAAALGDVVFPAGASAAGAFPLGGSALGALTVGGSALGALTVGGCALGALTVGGCAFGALTVGPFAPVPVGTLPAGVGDGLVAGAEPGTRACPGAVPAGRCAGWSASGCAGEDAGCPDEGADGNARAEGVDRAGDGGTGDAGSGDGWVGGNGADDDGVIGGGCRSYRWGAAGTLARPVPTAGFTGRRRERSGRSAACRSAGSSATASPTASRCLSGPVPESESCPPKTPPHADTRPPRTARGQSIALAA